MVRTLYQIVWTKRSRQHLKAAYKYISEDSPQNAVKVIEDIVTAVNKAISIPNSTMPINTRLIMMEVTEPLKNTAIE